MGIDVIGGGGGVVVIGFWVMGVGVDLFMLRIFFNVVIIVGFVGCGRIIWFNLLNIFWIFLVVVMMIFINLGVSFIFLLCRWLKRFLVRWYSVINLVVFRKFVFFLIVWKLWKILLRSFWLLGIFLRLISLLFILDSRFEVFCKKLCRRFFILVKLFIFDFF